MRLRSKKGGGCVPVRSTGANQEMTNFFSLFSRMRAKFVLAKFNLKKRWLSLTYEQIKTNNNELSSKDFWDQTIFPNYSKLKIRMTSEAELPPRADSTRLNNPLLKHLNAEYSYLRLLQSSLIHLWTNVTSATFSSLNMFKRSIGEGAIYIRGLLVLFFFDACLTDDEPLWEPVEWSLVQSWLLFIFAFAWIAENLISSRFGSYTGRDKRVWFAWYKSFWLIVVYYAVTLGATALFVIIPFYHEITYSLPLVVSWWHWYSRVFFFKFISLYSIALYISYYLQLNIGSQHWRTSFLLILIVNLFLSYLLYTHFMVSFFAYFTDPNWYHSTRLTDYIQLSHEPHKWSWGNSKRDHFSYHRSTTVFWFKNDGPFAAAFLLINIMFFLSLFSMYLYWLTLLRRVYATQEITYTYTTYCVSALRQFFYSFLMLYILVFFSFVVTYWRLPAEYFWTINSDPVYVTLCHTFCDYLNFLCSI